MVLPIARRAGNGGMILPSAAAITKCMQLSTTAEAAAYLRDQAEPMFAKFISQPAVKEVMDVITLHADNMSMAQQDSDVWAGKPTTSSFETLQQGLAERAATQIDAFMEQKATPVVFDFAVNNAAQFLRGYSSEGEAVEPAVAEMMDELFNSWLAENKMISKGGVIYEVTEDGQVKKDAKGNDINADAEKLRERISSPTDGFERFVARKSEALRVTAREQAYPGEVEEAAPAA